MTNQTHWKANTRSQYGSSKKQVQNNIFLLTEDIIKGSIRKQVHVGVEDLYMVIR